MSLNEQLAEAGLLEAFDRTVADHDRAAFGRVLRAIGLDEVQIEKTWTWVFHSPYSPHNVDPSRVSEELALDRRIAGLADPDKRAVQYLFETAGGFGQERCRWRDCNSLALRGLAYCPYCASVHLGIRTVSRP
jgi:hypothetical protein